MIEKWDAHLEGVGHAELIGIAKQGVAHVGSHLARLTWLKNGSPNAFFPGASSATSQLNTALVNGTSGPSIRRTSARKNICRDKGYVCATSK